MSPIEPYDRIQIANYLVGGNIDYDLAQAFALTLEEPSYVRLNELKKALDALTESCIEGVYSDGYDEGYSEAVFEDGGYDKGYEDGVEHAHKTQEDEYSKGYDLGFREGFDEGYRDATLELGDEQ